ncbi:MAG: DUF2515 domain-containing protein, partial [Myxococcota bacterium]|nr:DUF2515 domain-containing protein [Myxococcota bacterium]
MHALRAMRDELDARNRDNVSRTASYLELYAWTRAHPAELPWLLMAHLVSRNAGYLMTDLAGRIDALRDPMLAAATTKLFVMLERANFLIFYDAWHHVCAHLLGESHTLAPPRTPAFVCDAWARYESACARTGRTPSAQLERALVMDLVHNEQHLIERRAVHHRELVPGLHMLQLVEVLGQERSLILPWPDRASYAPSIRVGDFASVERRIATGARIFDLALADRARRDAMFAWALEHPHTGSRAAYGGRPGPA